MIIPIYFVTDLLYRQTVPINGTPVELEVIDVSGSNSDKFPTEQVTIIFTVSAVRRPFKDK